MSVKKAVIVPLCLLSSSLLIVMGEAKNSMPQPMSTFVATPQPTSSATATPFPTASPSAQATPSCLTAQQSSKAIATVLTPEQTKQAVDWIKQGKEYKTIFSDLNLTRQQKRELKSISRQQCKQP